MTLNSLAGTVRKALASRDGQGVVHANFRKLVRDASDRAAVLHFH